MECNLTLSDAADSRRHHNGSKDGGQRETVTTGAADLPTAIRNSESGDAGVAATHDPATARSVLVEPERSRGNASSRDKPNCKETPASPLLFLEICRLDWKADLQSEWIEPCVRFSIERIRSTEF